MSDNDKDLSLIAHLEELRNTIFRCLIAIVIVLPFVFYFSPRILDYLTKLTVGNNDITLNYFAPMEVFILQLKLSLLIDAVICFPYIAKNLWDFILPALYDNERKFIRTIVLSSSALFMFGVLFCLFIIVPMIINFGISFSRGEIHAMFGISNVVNLALNLALVFGLMFQIPLVVNMLIRWDILTYEGISKYRPYVVVVLLIFAALLTPPDIVSQVFLFIPTYCLFELGLLFSQKSSKDKEE